MLEDAYHLALKRVTDELDSLQVAYVEDEGELIFANHRFGLAIACEGLIEQDNQVLAPLEWQIHVGAQTGDQFRVGTLGIGADRAAAIAAAVDEWWQAAAVPLLRALEVLPGRDRWRLADFAPRWEAFAGAAGLRGTLPSAIRSGGIVVRQLLASLVELTRGWPATGGDELRSICVVASQVAGELEIEAAIDGIVDPKLTETLLMLSWPRQHEGYLYKQLFVLRRPVGKR